ncbi:DUF2514 family protein [Variovorax boronicumulans]|uniref:DUF2514 family protein n=1 Tax=Variovorax boronicumulans TaxID=436515 RepID=UPI0012E45E17|nr:DUF2514 family protein [Variovorax boronicumulans]GER16670.1 DUF2514 domain-containing protein [Variovorax boronicumulans]
MIPDLRNVAIWLLLALAVGGWGVGCVERTRAAGARKDASTAQKDLAEYRATQAESARAAERAARNQEQNWRSRVDEVIQDGQQKIAGYRAAADRAGASERRVREQLAAYRAAVRSATAAPPVAGGGAPTTDPLDLLSDLFGRADARAGELARIADQRGAAGAVCERHADAVK